MPESVTISLAAVEDLLITLDQNIFKCREVSKDFHDGYGYLSEDTLFMIEELSTGSNRLEEYINKYFGLSRPEAQKEGAKFKLNEEHTLVLAHSLAELLKIKTDLETRSISFKKQ